MDVSTQYWIVCLNNVKTPLPDYQKEKNVSELFTFENYYLRWG